MDYDIAVPCKNWRIFKIVAFISTPKQQIYNRKSDTVFSHINFSCMGF